ncbi:[FeFe] hydrogenase H-cluster radical SAM maturase HydG [Anaerococcus tetradius]|uniref:Iron-only hydrogenase maturation rSAM protein HydG n=1 Tax=Anaerococcus tetradius TaxID=33036 RepID=A0A133KB67_9FIRM|nr:[FeFe] hydrogenase H-cluster radical SAM maturase HydG [Anaerococcus tetradius]KWZ76705.1 iron-only hydrogenase maturation rSAM protein HydG [Anaerococcus tetradius]
MVVYNPKSKDANEFINHEEILETLDYGRSNAHNRELIIDILNKAKKAKGLSHREAFVLLSCKEDDLNEEIFNLARELKHKFYANRIVLFAPLYLSNYCVNGCSYCPYHGQNKTIPRRKLTQDEIREQVIALQDLGHKRLALEAGEDPIHNPLEYILESIHTIYNIKHKNGAIRRVNVNIAATTVENYRKLHEAEIGTYILFQETYNKKNYEAIHKFGPKSNYEYHTEAMDRAFEGGIDDLGLGVLYGLDSYEYEFVGQLMHAEHLEARFNVGPHTISVPRIQPADDIDPNDFDNSLSDEMFEKIVACIRVAAPYTGMIVSTRESEKVRAKLLELGISQISGGSKTSVGGYTDDETKGSDQFELSDNRSLDEIIDWLIAKDHVPSFCTACYRKGRTGETFMGMVKQFGIGNICHPNAITTLEEYLVDYASDKTKKDAEALIQRELDSIPNPEVRKSTIEKLEEIRQGQRDLYI